MFGEYPEGGLSPTSPQPPYWEGGLEHMFNCLMDTGEDKTFPFAWLYGLSSGRQT